MCYYLNQFLSITQQLTQKNALALAWTSELCFFPSQLRFLTVFASAHLGISVASPSRPGSRRKVHWEQRGDVPCSTCTAWAPAQVWELDPCGSQEETSRVGFIPPFVSSGRKETSATSSTSCTSTPWLGGPTMTTCSIQCSPGSWPTTPHRYVFMWMLCRYPVTFDPDDQST